MDSNLCPLLSMSELAGFFCTRSLYFLIRGFVSSAEFLLKKKKTYGDSSKYKMHILSIKYIYIDIYVEIAFQAPKWSHFYSGCHVSKPKLRKRLYMFQLTRSSQILSAISQMPSQFPCSLFIFCFSLLSLYFFNPVKASCPLQFSGFLRDFRVCVYIGQAFKI